MSCVPAPAADTATGLDWIMMYLVSALHSGVLQMAGPGQDEDCVRYWLYPAGDSSAACSTTALARVCSLASRYTQHWVWHDQQFGLRVEHGEGDQWWLTGSTRFAPPLFLRAWDKFRWVALTLSKYCNMMSCN